MVRTAGKGPPCGSGSESQLERRSRSRSPARSHAEHAGGDSAVPAHLGTALPLDPALLGSAYDETLRKELSELASALPNANATRGPYGYLHAPDINRLTAIAYQLTECVREGAAYGLEGRLTALVIEARALLELNDASALSYHRGDSPATRPESLDILLMIRRIQNLALHARNLRRARNLDGTLAAPDHPSNTPSLTAAWGLVVLQSELNIEDLLTEAHFSAFNEYYRASVVVILRLLNVSPADLRKDGVCAPYLPELFALRLPPRAGLDSPCLITGLPSIDYSLPGAPRDTAFAPREDEDSVHDPVRVAKRLILKLTAYAGVMNSPRFQRESSTNSERSVHVPKSLFFHLYTWYDEVKEAMANSVIACYNQAYVYDRNFLGTPQYSPREELMPLDVDDAVRSGEWWLQAMVQAVRLLATGIR